MFLFVGGAFPTFEPDATLGRIPFSEFVPDRNG
jgi:hypothetical protein